MCYLVFLVDVRETLVYEKEHIFSVFPTFFSVFVILFSLNFCLNNLQPRLFVGRGMQEGPLSLLK